jgi:DNA-damage-inducible protein D
MKALAKTTSVADKIAVFEDKKIRRILHNGEWYFSIIDIIRVLTESSDPNRYWPELKKKLIGDEGFNQLLDKIEQLKLESADGKKYLTDTANTETVFRIIQSIRSPKAEPFGPIRSFPFFFKNSYSEMRLRSK